MKNLNIKLINKDIVKIWGLPSVEGEITLNDFHERFYASIDSWSTNDYLSQWSDGLKRLSKYKYSCLVTNVQMLKSKPLINIWPMQIIDNKLYIQNHLIFGKTYSNKIGNRSFTPLNCYDFIKNWKINKITGSMASEWIIDLPKEFKNQSLSYQVGIHRIRKHRSKWAL